MTIQIELSPEDESRLTREAVARGVRPEKYAGDLLQAALAHVARPEEYNDMRDLISPKTEIGAMTVDKHDRLFLRP